VVANTGNVTLTNVRVTDAAAPGCARTSVEVPALASLASGATVSYQCSLADVDASFTNVAVATGTPPAGPEVTSSDTAHVTVKPTETSTKPGTTPGTTPGTKPGTKPTPVVTPPSISIRKEPKVQDISAGGTASFQITVTNTGGVELHDVTVQDPLSPDCERSLGTLAPAASSAYACSRPDVTESFDNVATATGKPPSGPSVTASDHAPVTVKPFKPPPANKTRPAKHKKHPKPQISRKHQKPKMTG
jgi:uncharacterized repeat protein (TIGR01451 family)